MIPTRNIRSPRSRRSVAVNSRCSAPRSRYATVSVALSSMSSASPRFRAASRASFRPHPTCQSICLLLQGSVTESFSCSLIASSRFTHGTASIAFAEPAATARTPQVKSSSSLSLLGSFASIFSTIVFALLIHFGITRFFCCHVPWAIA